MSELRIPYGVDPQGRYVHIEEAEHNTHYYTCPICGEYLQPRQGEIYRWYFAHDIASLNSPDCELRSGPWFKEFCERAKISPLQQLENQRKMRLLIKMHPYRKQLELFGVIPSSRIEDFSNISKIEEILNNIKINSNCLIKTLYPNQFHPSEGLVQIPINPTIEKFEINISTDPNIKSINGRWLANGLQSNDIFIGDLKSAIKFEPDPRNLDKGIRINNGDIVYIIFKEPLHDLPTFCQTYTLGKFFVVSFEFNEKTKNFVSKYNSSVQLENEPFDLDVILPPNVTPNPILPIEGKKGSEAVIAIIPPKDKDPTFELVSIPINIQKETEFKNIGLGKPRFFSVDFPETGSVRLSVHWGVRHKDVNICTEITEKNNKYQWEFEKPIGIKIFNDIYLPYKDNPNPICYNIPINNSEFNVEFLCPDDMAINIEGIKNIDEIFTELSTANNINDIIKDWINSNIKKFTISFGSLGSINIELHDKFSITDEIIKARILEMKQFPKKANWKLVRYVYQIENSVPKEFLHGRKKQVRRVLMTIRRERL